jgi:uncharacterized membrane protein YdjX (TVP38/TMEM64 family)
MVVGKSPMASLLERRERSMVPPTVEKATIYSALKFQQLKAEVRKRGLMIIFIMIMFLICPKVPITFVYRLVRGAFLLFVLLSCVFLGTFA